MREAQFKNQNTSKWLEFEKEISKDVKTNPDKLADLFVQLTDDLSYARSNYPDSQTTLFLNNLTAKVHQSIYRNKKESKSRFLTFWSIELPSLFYSCHKQLLYSFIIFSLSLIIGVVSSANEEDFPRLILGDSYVNMTIDNIKKGDPMGVYKDNGEMEMFYFIPLHNIQVMGMSFIAGVLSMTWYFLFQNGVMVGTFQYFFYKYGLLGTSALSIWIHGTLEISCLILGGCAGLVMGNSILFPGTYSRMESFKSGAKKGLKIAIGITPLLVVAGFLESFVTRHTEMPTFFKLSIIILSAIFIIWYFIIYPIQLNRNNAIEAGAN